MSKKKLLASLLCVTLVGPLAACDGAGNTSTGGNSNNSTNVSNSSNGGTTNSSNGGTTNSSNSSNGGTTNSSNGGTVTETTQEKLTKAANATKEKLVEELNKDVFALKLDLEYDSSITEEEVITDYVFNENYDKEETNSSKEKRTQSMTEKLNLVANLDLKYYTDLLTAEDPTTLTNTSAGFVSVDAAATYNGESEGTSYVQAQLKDGVLNAKMKATNSEGQSQTQDADPITLDAETDATIAGVLAQVKEFASYSNEEFVNTTIELLKAYIISNSIYTDEETGESNEEEMTAMVNTVFDNVLGFINGTVTTEKLVEEVLPIVSATPWEEIPEQAKALIVDLVNYAIDVDYSSLVTLTEETKEGATFYIVTFNYDALKTLIAKVFDDLEVIFTKALTEEEAVNVVAGMNASETELFATLPKTLEFSIDLGVENGLITSFYNDILMDGYLPNGGGSSGYETDEEGKPTIGSTITVHEYFLTNVDCSYGFSFEFGSTPYTIPEFSI